MESGVSPLLRPYLSLLILLPAQGDEDEISLKNMVQEVNETQVEREEVLSDSVYYYDRESGELTIV